MSVRRFVLVGWCGLLSACTGLVGDAPAGVDASVSADSGVLITDDAGTVISDDAGAPSDAGAVDAGTPDAGIADAGLPGRTVFAIGGQDMRTLVSFDGVTWLHDAYVAPNGQDNAFSGVAIGKGGIIMTGDPGIYRSTDGVSWTLVQARPSRFSFHSSAAAFADGKFVVLAQDTGWRSADGLTWESKLDTPGASGHWHALAFGNGHWVGLGDLLRKVSENGLDWHDPTAFLSGLFEDVAFGNGVFVAVGKEGSDGWVATSTDGLTWTKSATVPTMYATGLATVTFGNGVFVTSTCCSTLKSTDGVTWTPLTNNGAGGKLVFSGGTFVSSGWRTEASVLVPDGGAFAHSLTGDRPNLYEDGGLAPWFTGLGAGEL